MAGTSVGNGYLDVYTRTAILTTEYGYSPQPGEGICIFFYDAAFNFAPGGIGSAMGYTNYRGQLEELTDTPVENTLSATYMRGMPGAYVGVSLDVAGEFSTPNNGKSYLLGESCTPVTGLSANQNTICTRGPSFSAYQIVNTTDNLSTYSLAQSAAPPFTLHQFVSSRDDVTFKSVKVSMIEGGQRCLVYLKEQTGTQWYQYADVDLSAFSSPENVKVGMSFSTGSKVMTCELKNFAVNGKFKNVTPTYNGHSGVWLLTGWQNSEPYNKETYVEAFSSFLPDTPAC